VGERQPGRCRRERDFRRKREKRSRHAVSPLPLERAPVVVSFHHVLLVLANLPFAGSGAVLRFGRFERPSLLA